MCGCYLNLGYFLSYMEEILEYQWWTTCESMYVCMCGFVFVCVRIYPGVQWKRKVVFWIVTKFLRLLSYNSDMENMPLKSQN